jgi:polyisoprenyl-phosphate glycosyltransferase
MECEYEIVFVNDGSRDRSFEILTGESSADHRVKVVNFSRNFGHQTALTAGLDFATGDAVVVMDCDLQDPPKLLPLMVELYKEGYDVVSPRRVSRRSDTWLKRTTAALFYAAMRNLSDTPMPAQVGDFRLFSRRAVVALRQLREQHRFMRGMVAWLGLREAFVPFERQPRAAGVTKYPLWKMLRFSWTAVTSFSAAPLRMTVTFGFAAVALAFCYFIWALISAVIMNSTIVGWASLVFLQCFFFGSTLICVGLIGEYIARIYEEAKGRPLYVVDRVLNLPLPSRVERMIVLEPEREEAIPLDHAEKR